MGDGDKRSIGIKLDLTSILTWNAVNYTSNLVHV